MLKTRRLDGVLNFVTLMHRPEAKGRQHAPLVRIKAKAFVSKYARNIWCLDEPRGMVCLKRSVLSARVRWTVYWSLASEIIVKVKFLRRWLDWLEISRAARRQID